MAAAQENEPEIPANVTELLESVAERTDQEPEDDSFLQLLEEYRRRPLNLNTATEAEVRELRLLYDVQIQHFLRYRELLGALVSVYELQAIPTWDILTIRKILPYISVSSEKSIVQRLRQRLFAGDNSFLLRTAMVLPKSKGFLQQDSTSNSYLGSRQQLLFRYKYTYKNLLQYGLLGEKDAGEELFEGSQKRGFDFYSFHIFARRLGAIKAIAIGDFTVSMGQGLIQWQGLAFDRTSSVASVKRQAEVIRPYSSSGEYNFSRGAGITLMKDRWETTAFVSSRKLSATFDIDSSNLATSYVSSLNTSGYHRTSKELRQRNNIHQTNGGAVLKYTGKRWHAGMNWVEHFFSHQFRSSEKPYDWFSMQGNGWRNFSVDYSFTFRNFHFFGENAVDRDFHHALISGCIASIDRLVDLSVVFRKINKAYQALNGNAFTVNTRVSNETGLYAGLTLKPSHQLRLDTYLDVYHSPWLRFAVDAPSYGAEYSCLLSYVPNRQLSLSMRYRVSTREANIDAGFPSNQVTTTPRKTFRYQFNYILRREITVSHRAEVIRTGSKDRPESGFLVFADLKYKPVVMPVSITARLQYFESDSYNTRIYAYENDVLYANSSPAFFDKGFRWYLILRTSVNKIPGIKSSSKIDLWVKYAATHYFELDKIGSELNEIQGEKRSEIKLQLIYSR